MLFSLGLKATIKGLQEPFMRKQSKSSCRYPNVIAVDGIVQHMRLLILRPGQLKFCVMPLVSVLPQQVIRKHGIQESSSNNPSKQKACQQSVEPTVKRKGAKDAIKALTSKLQSMSPRAFMRKQAKAHVDTPTCARQLMYSSTHGTCDIEARDINNSCNATPVLVLHTSHGVKTSPSNDTGDKNHGILGSSSLLMNRVPRWGQVSSPASFRKHGKEESSSNNPSKQKACQQSVEPTVKRKGAKDAIKALTSKLQSMSPRAFMRKQAKAHVNTPTCARQLMYSSTHGTCDIEARDINNSCNATPVSVLHTSHGVNTSPSDVTRDKNLGISGSSYLLMNRVPRWGQVSSPASFRKHGKEESSSNFPSKQKACQQSVEPTVKRKGAKDAIKALTSKVLHSSHGVNTSPSDDTGDKNCGISGSSSLLMNRVPRWGQVSSPASFRKHGKEESSSNNPSKQKACQQSVEPTVKRKGAKDAIKALTSKLQSMSPRAFMRKQAKAHVDTPTCARQLMYSSTHGTCDIEARDINNSCNATPIPFLHTSHGVNTSPSDDTRDKNQESSSNNPSKQKACQQSVEPTVKRKGAKDAIKALTSKLQSMSPRAFMRKHAKAHVDTPTSARQLMYSYQIIYDVIVWIFLQLQSMSPRAFMRKHAKAHVDTPTSARQLMYSSTHGTCDIEARDINNLCKATPVPVLHISHGVNTSPFDDTRDKNRGISGSSSLLMNRVPRWGQVSSPASFRKNGIEESSSNNPSKQKACQQSVEPTVKRKGAKDATKALTSNVLQSMSPRAFMRKQAKAHVDTPTCARQLMYSSTHGTCDIEARDINNSCNATLVLVLHTSHGVNTSPSDDTGDKNRRILGSSSLLMNRVPRWGQVSSPASFRKHGKEESSSNNPSKQKACQQSVEPTVKRKGAKDAIKALTSKLQSMSPRAFMRKQAKAHVDTPTCARQLMYSSTHGTCNIEARDINNSGNATPVPVLHTSHGVNTSPSDELVVRSTLTEQVKQIQEWMEQYRPVRNSFGKERQRGGGKITNKKYTNITMLMATSTRYSFKSKANS
ncbi:hypothetical protein Tco_0000937 [Tanacetum coccineum]